MALSARSLRGCVFVMCCCFALGAAGLVRAEGQCPDPTTCEDYRAFGHWDPSTETGTIEIPYYINPVQPWVPVEEAVAAINAAFHTWDDALPTVGFRYEGTTLSHPIRGDGVNVVGWGSGLGGSAITSHSSMGDVFVEADTSIELGYPIFVSYGCAQANGSCTDRASDFPDGWYLWPEQASPNENIILAVDIQNLMTHEVGHWLGLADLDAGHQSELTMNPDLNAGAEEVQLKKVTLGLGDVLGVRSLYPCGCPLPLIYTP